MDKRDHEALTLAMEHASRDPARAVQLRAKLKDEPWEDVAEFAAFCAQGEALHLEPWSMPPCRGDSEHHPDPAAKKLLQQMLDLGISRYAPDPMAAIEQAKRETVK